MGGEGDHIYSGLAYCSHVLYDFDDQASQICIIFYFLISTTNQDFGILVHWHIHLNFQYGSHLYTQLVHLLMMPDGFTCSQIEFGLAGFSCTSQIYCTGSTIIKIMFITELYLCFSWCPCVSNSCYPYASVAKVSFFPPCFLNYFFNINFNKMVLMSGCSSASPHKLS